MGSVLRRMRRHIQARRKLLKKVAAKRRRSKFEPAEVKPPVSPRRTRLEEAQLRMKHHHGSAHRLRELICAENHVPNTGRQWVRLRRRLSREERN